MTIDAVRTPDDRFVDLPDFDFTPNYVDDLEGYEGLRMAYLDEGPKDASVTFVCLHGEPSWSFLYRKMIPIFTAAGYRVIAPDLFGFGRSDKPTDLDTYTFHFHRGSLTRLLDRLALENVCLVVQDWGGLLGLTLPMDYPETITRLLVMNTALAVGMPGGRGFEEWKTYVAEHPDFDIRGLFKRSEPHLSDAELDAYAAPFPSVEFRAGVTTFPALVMVDPSMPGVEESMAAASFLSTKWTGDSFMAVGMKDPVLGPKIMAMLKNVIRGCPEPLEIADAGHFVQESGEEVAKAALAHFEL